MSYLHGLHLHHVGYAVAEIEPNTQLYIARYGYQVACPIIHDPLQTARVQFLKLAGDHTYLEFVAPDGPQSKLTTAIKQGGGLNHLCYTTGPLEAAIEHLESTGMKLISDPKPGAAFAGRRICWLVGRERMAVELVERRDADDFCAPDQ